MSGSLQVDLSKYVHRAGAARAVVAEGRVHEVVGVLVGVEGVTAPVGAQLDHTLGPSGAVGAHRALSEVARS